jgi:hypothetical protein
MTDALRSDRSGDTPERERDARIEELLLAGLDHYFAGQHELAINVWTRVLFLDRGHARARAYIQRARSAVSERQREGEELVSAGAAALARGDRPGARRLLTSAIDRGASSEEALALLHRLDRMEAAAYAADAAGAAVPRPPSPKLERSASAPARDARLAWIASGLAAGVLLAAAGGAYVVLVADPFGAAAARTAGPSVPEDPLPVPSACELRLARARVLFAGGRLREALALLDEGDPDERHRRAMDDLRGTIQRQLLGSLVERAAAPGASRGAVGTGGR